MSVSWVFVGALLLGGVAEEDADGPRIQIVQVPDRNLVEQIRAYLPDVSVTRTLAVDGFQRLLDQYRASLDGRRFRIPTVARLAARIDSAAGTLEGEGVWSAPLGAGPRWRLKPWNLSVVEVDDGEGRPLNWGLDGDGGLVVAASGEVRNQVRVRWSLRPRVEGADWIYAMQLPASGAARLDLEPPEGRDVVGRPADASILSEIGSRLFASPDGRLEFRATPRVGGPQARSLAYSLRTECRVTEAHVDYRATLVLDVARRPTERIDVELDSRLVDPAIESGPPGVWRRVAQDGGRSVWSLEASELGAGRREIRLAAREPRMLGRAWSPPRLSVRDAAPLVETVVVWIESGLKLTRLDPGGFRLLHVGDEPDGGFSATFQGSAASGAAPSGLLTGADFGDWRKLCVEVVRQVDGKQDGAASSLGRLIGPEGLALARRVSSEGDVSPEEQRRLLVAFNDMLQRIDLAEDEAFRAVVGDADRWDREGDGPGEDSVSTRVARNRRILELAFPDQVRERRDGARRPVLRVESEGTRVVATRRLQLDLSKRPFEAVGEFDASVLQGSVSQVVLRAPPNWRIGEVRLDPPHRLGSVRSQPNEDGSSVVWGTLAQPCSAGEAVRLELVAYFAGNVESAVGETAVNVPDFEWIDPPSEGPATVEVRLDPHLKANLDRLPPPDLKRGAVGSFAGDDDVYVFTRSSRLDDATIYLSPPKPRFRAAVRHRARWRGDRWTARIELQLDVDRGEIETVHLSSTRPFPENAEWSVQGAAERGVRIQRFPGVNEDPAVVEQADPPSSVEDGAPSLERRFDYLLEFDTPVRGRIEVEAEWSVREPSTAIPLVDLLDADEFVANVVVQSRSGRIVDVRASGLDDAPPDPNSPEFRDEGVVWLAAYERLGDDASLSLAVRPLEQAAAPTAMGRAVVRCRSTIGRDQSVHDIWMQLDCGEPGPLFVGLPENARLWGVELDGVALRPTFRDGRVEAVPSLSVGMHDCRIVYSVPTDRRLGLLQAKLTAPLKDWDSPSFVWEVVHGALAYAVPGAELWTRTSLRRIDVDDGIVALEDSHAATAQAAAQSAYLDWRASDGDRSLAGFAERLGRSLPSGWLVVVDGDVLHRAPSKTASSEKVADWLADCGLVMFVHDAAVLLTSRVDSRLPAAPRVDWNSEQFVETVAREVARQGVDAGGAFFAPGAAPDASSRSGGPRPAADLAGGAGVGSVAHVFAVGNAAPDAVWTVLLVPDELLTRVARTLALVFVLATFGLARSWPPARLRGMLAVLVAFAGAAAVLGGVAHHAISLPIWATIAAVVVLFLRNAWSSRRSFPVVAAIFCAVASPESAKSEDRPFPYRVLVPTDADGTARRVVLPETLARALEAASGDEGEQAFFQTARLEGRVIDRARCRWRASLEAAWMPLPQESRRVRLGFGGVEPIRLSVDGAASAFQSTAAEGCLSFDAPPRGSEDRLLRVDLEFETPLTQAEGRFSIQFQIPFCGRTSVALAPDTAGVELTPSSSTAGWTMRTTDGRPEFVLSAGPLRTVDLHYRLTGESRASASLEADVVTLLDVREDEVDVLATVRLDSEGGSVDSVELSAPSFMAVSSVEVSDASADDLDAMEPAWSLTPDSADPLRRRLTISGSSIRGRATRLTVRGKLAADPVGTWPAPWIEVVGARAHRGMTGVRAPVGWTVQDVESRNVEAASPAAFAVAWSRARGESAPKGVEFSRRCSPTDGKGAPSLTLAVRRPSPILSIQQQHAVDLTPETGAIETTTIVNGVVRGSAVPMLTAKTPEGAVVVSVAGENVRSWFLDAGRLHVLPKTPFVDDFVVRVASTRRFRPPNLEQAEPFSISLPPLEWLEASAVSNRWRVDPPFGWRAASSSARDGAATNPQEGSLTLNTGAGESPSILLQPANAESTAAAVTFVQVRDGASTIEGRVEIPGAGGLAGRVQLRSSAELTEQSWEAPGLPAPTSRVEGRDRVWTFDARRARTRDVVIRWRTSLASGRPKTVVPNVRWEGAAPVERWIVVANATSRTLAAETTGLTASTPPERVWTSLGGDVRKFHEVAAYRAESDDWTLSFSTDRDPRPQEAYAVLSAEAEVFQAVDGSLRGVSRWDVRDLRDGVYRIKAARSIRTEGVSLDGLPLSPSASGEGVIEFPVFRSGKRQEIHFTWSAPAVPSGSTFELPRLAGDSDLPVLIRVRRPRNYAWTSEAAKLSRVDWLMRRLVSRLEGIQSGLAESNGAHDLERERRAAEFADLARAIRFAGPEAAPEVLDRLAELEKQVPAGLWRTRPGAAVKPDRVDVLEAASAEHHEYFLASNAKAEFLVRTSAFPSGGGRTTDERLRIAVAALTFALVVAPPFWRAMRLYWPAPMFATGLAWWRFADTSAVGVALLAVSALGAAWCVRRWFEGAAINESSTSTRRSTHARRAPQPTNAVQ
jgi:hypothetical protein